MDAIRLAEVREGIRRAGRPPSTKPTRDRGGHASALREQLSAAVAAHQLALSARDPSLPAMPAGLQLLVEPARDEKGASLLAGHEVPKGWKLQVAEERQDGTLVTLLPDGDTGPLLTLIDAWKDDARDATGKALPGTGKVGHLERVVRARRGDRMGEALADIDLSVEAEHIVDVELRAGDAEDDGSGAARRGTLRAYVQQCGGVVIGDGIVAADYAVLRVRLRASAILDLLDHRFDLLHMDLPPKLEREAWELRRGPSEDTFPEIVPPAPDAPVIGVIDGGVVSAQPLLVGALQKRPHRSWIPGDAAVDVSPEDAKHGSAVASIAALGSLRECLVRQEQPVRSLGVCVARVLIGPDADLPDELNLAARLGEITAHLRDEGGARVINHSIASTATFRTSRMSVWAERLDHIAYDEGHAGFLFVVASGNVDGAYSPSERWLREQVQAGQFPSYLRDERCRLRDPAQAINVLTVGGYVPDAAAPWPVRTTLGLEPLASSNEISPFSRTGPGYARVIKPEVVEEAGNFYRDASGTLNKTPRWTDVAAADPDWLASGTRVRFTNGTSFAAPRVAHLAGRVLEALPSASPDLLRALVVNSAEWPSRGARDERENALRTFGYGVPRPERIFDIGGSRSVVVIEGRIPIQHVQYFAVPFPREIFAAPTSTVVRVSVTLAYRAPVRRTNKRYRGVVLDWSMAKRGESFEHFISRLEKVEDDEAPADDTTGDDDVITATSDAPSEIDEPIDDWAWTVGRHPRSRGTVQKDWFEAPVAYFSDAIVLAVSARRGWMSERDAREVRQRFALALSFEVVGTAVPLHETIKERIRAQPKVAIK